jgi:ubiquinone/menaquinone biosynthesis C-methylase UbiE
MPKKKANLKDAIFSFNGYNRGQWVAEIAETIRPCSDILDAGAGTGLYRDLFSHCNYKTQDFCQEPTTQGKYSKMDYVCNITNIPVPDESFDVIVCTEVLEHVPEPIKVIEEFSRILRQNGRLFITAPLGCGLHQKPYIFYGGYTPFWYQKFLPMFGFENLKIIPNRGFFGYYSQESRRFLKFLFPRNMGNFTKILTFPLKVLLSVWFRKIIPVSCYFLDKFKFDKDRDFTVGYFVEASKKA